MLPLFHLMLLAKMIDCGVRLEFENECVFNGELFWNQIVLTNDVRFNILSDDVTDYVDDVLSNWFMRSPKTTPATIYAYPLGEGRTNLTTREDPLHVVIMNSETLHTLIDNNTLTKFVPVPKATYIFVILESKSEPCTINTEMNNVLEVFWKHYSIIRLLAMKPCSHDRTLLYRYDPFAYNETSGLWGIVRNKTFDKLDELAKPMNSLGLGGYPLKVSLFPRVPTAVKDLPPSMSHLNCHQDWSHGFRGLDGCVLANMAQYLNFTVVLVGPGDASNYGYKLENGSFVGSLGDVVYKRADISANSRFINVFDAFHTEFSTPVYNDLVCFIVPKAEVIPKWKMIFQCFKLSTWIILLLVILSSGLLWNVSYKIRFGAEPYHPKKLIFSLLDVLRIFLSSTFPNIPFLIHRRLLLMTCMIFNVIIVGIFQGSLFTSFSSISYYSDINTLEELYDSNLPIATSLDLFQSDDPDIMKKLQARTLFLASKALKRAATAKDVAAVERMEDARFYIQTQYMSNTGIPLLHIVAECPSSYFLAYIVPKNSPFLTRFNLIVTKFREAGLIQKWYYDIVDGLILNYNFNNYHVIEEYKEINISDVQTPFYLLVIGIFISSISFFVEIYVN